MSARREDFWEQFDETGDLEEAADYVKRNPDATVAEILGACELELSHRDDVEALLENVDDTEETRVGNWQTDDCDIYGGRSTTKHGRVKHFANTEIDERGWLGNPYVTDEHASAEHREQSDVQIVDTRSEAVARFCIDFLNAVDDCPELRRVLYEDVRGGVLGGWCQELDDDAPRCHLEVVADVADRLRKRGGLQ